MVSAAAAVVSLAALVGAVVSFELDESLLTGEADPVDKAPGDEVLSGSFVVAGSKAGDAFFAAVDDLKPGYEAVDVNRCLEVAARALDEAAAGDTDSHYEFAAAVAEVAGVVAEMVKRSQMRVRMTQLKIQLI